MVRHVRAGSGTGRPTVPTETLSFDAGRPPAAALRGGGSASNRAFAGAKPLVSAAAAMVSSAASCAMYCERLPGLGWLLNHCGGAPFDCRPIVSNIRARSRGS